MNELRGLWRGKSVDNGEWVEGFLSKSRNIWEKPALLKFCIDYEEKGVMVSCIVDPKTLGECTGLRDKNGKLIFEGDILDFPDYSEQDVVEWDDEYSVFYLTDTDYSFTGVASVCEAKNGVVIGNIHDNPELLKGADKNAEKD
ncbi:MAG: hypothetical protein HDT42_04765 [Ruminococcaceae bacterium]|nr:hypothetical protein [Oscillospiraceae bacterium]